MIFFTYCSHTHTHRKLEVYLFFTTLVMRVVCERHQKKEEENTK
jgi:hypothetical protein